MNKLKSCPFCGDKDVVHEYLDDDRGNHFQTVRCTLCCSETGRWKTKQKAIAAWNRRAGEKP